MELVCIPLALLGAGLVVAGIAGLIVVLLKLGVIARYATQDEPPDTANYSLEESRDAGEAGPGTSRPRP